ncbi:MAG: hypothetical protein LC792_00140, partial [Actinobacteria bacterium]|nr:hypothetical protein [Actinomycetota bacterium]
LSEAYGPAGGSVTATGSAFNPAYGQIAVHWGAIDGPVLAQGTPDASGIVGPFTVKIPEEAKPGYYVLVFAAAENPHNALMARVAFQVVGVGGSPARAPVGLQPAASTGSHSTPGIGMLGALGLAGMLGVGLFGAGAAVTVRGYRRVAAPVRSGPEA